MKTAPVRFSLDLPTTRVEAPDEFVTGEAIALVTRAAAAAGFSAVNVTDHPAPNTRWLDHGGHHALDPFVALAFAAAADKEIKLHTNVYIAAYRNPFLGAKQVQSLDVLSGGRVLLGVAAGYLKPEFAALGIDFESRGKRLDDALDVLDAALRGDDVSREGPGYVARGVRLAPIQPNGRPPIWVGGNSTVAMRRAARYDGWAPFHTGGYADAARTAAIESVDDLAAAIKQLRSWTSVRQGFDICWSEQLLSDAQRSVDQRASRIAELTAVGVTWITVSIPARTRTELVAAIEAFGRDLIS